MGNLNLFVTKMSKLLKSRFSKYLIFLAAIFFQFQEVLSVRGPDSSLDIQLSGQGVTPDLRVDLEENKLHFGHVLQGETTTATFNVN